MFDTVYGEFFCPFCGKSITSFQTKSLECLLDSYKWIRRPGDISSGSWETVKIYSSCPSCGEWVELIVRKERLVKIKEKRKSPSQRQIKKLFQFKKPKKDVEK
jgi:predicted RNA-binding Zn-ribbon protein involved in translation (DUF1610 family)